MGTATVGGKRNTLSRRNLVIVIALVILYIIIANIPNDGASLSMEGQKILALMVVTIIAWIFEVIPIGLMAMVALMLQIPLGIMDMSATMVNFGQNIFFFVIGCFGIASAMRRSGLGTRLMLAVTISSLRIKKQGEVKNFCRSHPAGPRRIGLAQSSGKSTLPTKE